MDEFSFPNSTMLFSEEDLSTLKVIMDGDDEALQQRAAAYMGESIGSSQTDSAAALATVAVGSFFAESAPKKTRPPVRNPKYTQQT